MMLKAGGLFDLASQQIWQVTLLAALAALSVRCFCRHRPHLAYLLWLVVLAKCWVPPILSSRGGVFCWPPMVSTATTESADRTGEGQRAGVAADLSAGAASSAPIPEEQSVQIASPAPYEWPLEDAPDVGGGRLATTLFALWLAGACGLLGIACLQAFRWRRSLNAVALLSNDSLAILIDEVADLLRLRGRPRIVVTAASTGPAVYGWLRPTIVLPHRLLEEGNDANLRMVLAHEMIHIRRGDLFVGLVQFATQLVWWFHPLIWWACRQLTRERERSCDEAVLSALRCPPDSYAQCLLDVLKLTRASPLLSAFPGMRAIDVTRSRFEHILQSGGRSRGHTPLRYWLIAGAVLCVVLPGARLTVATPGKPKTPLTSLSESRTVGQPSRPSWAQVGLEGRPTDAPAQPSGGSGIGTESGDGLAPQAKSNAGRRVGRAKRVPPPPPLVALADDAPPSAPAEKRNTDELPAALDQAIQRGANYLVIQQTKDGNWADPVGYPGGITGLCTLALVRSGMKLDTPCLRTALSNLRKLKPAMTYSTALQTMVFCAADPKADQAHIKRNVDWFANQQKKAGEMTGAWGYPQAEGDNSNTGFAAAALFEAERVGIKVDRAVWRRLLDHWISTQNANGSWGYKPSVGGTGSMTSQGLFCVAAAAKVLGEDGAEQPGARATGRAADWLKRNFSVETNPGMRGAQDWHFYYLHALGQAGRTAGKEKFGEHDWFAEGAKVVLAEQQPDGSWKGAGHAEDRPLVATSLALLFLLNGAEQANDPR